MKKGLRDRPNNYGMMIKVLILICVLFIGDRIMAQEKERLYDFSFSQTPIEEVIAEVERQSGHVFSYESSLLRGFPAITLRMKSFSLVNVLERVFAANGVHYKVVRNYVVLKKRKPFFVISGTVRDFASLETLIQASVYDGKRGMGTMTNNHGFYSLALPGGKVQLTISFVGYKSYQTAFTLSRDTVISVDLVQDNRLDEVLVEGGITRGGIRKVQPGQVRFPVKMVNVLPSLLSESDLLKTLQLMPGVKTGSEGLAGLYVRGGNMDENLYLMDGVPLYNPSHLLGFFSTFNSDAVKNVDFYKSSFPARYGGRLSSVVDVRIKEGDMEAYHGSISVGLIASKLQLEGPIKKGKTSFNVSARRTYLDLIASPLIKSLTRSSSRDNLSYEKGGYYFMDVNAKVTHKFSERNQLALNCYWGHDKAWYGMYDKDKNLSGTDPRDYVSDDNWSWSWGNFIVALEWGARLNSRLYSNTSVSYSRYLSRINISMFEKMQTNKDSGSWKPEVLNDSYSHFNSGIYDWIVKSDFEYNLNERHTGRFGGSYAYHTFVPEMSRLKIASDDFGAGIPGNWQSRTESWVYGNEIALYAEDEIRLTERLRVHPGVRLALFRVERKNYFSVEPRFSLQYQTTKRLSMNVSYAEMSQYVHLLAFGGVSLPSDLWVPVSKEIKPMLSRQVSGGIYYQFNRGWDVSLEGYYKTMKNQIDYLDGASILPEYKNWKEHVAVGKGEAYGLEVQVQKSAGKTTGWVNYTLAWANRRFPGGEINYGRKYPAKYDSRHGVNIALVHRFNKRFDISAAWVFHSGARATIALEKYAGATVEGVVETPPTVDHVEYRNNFRMKAYHRLDLGFNFHRYRKRGVSTWSIGLYNAYSRLNPFFMYSDTERIAGSNARKPVLRQASIFPVIPSFSYTFRF